MFGNERHDLGKASTKQLRSEGKVPCVLYGKNTLKHFAMYQGDFKKLVYTSDTYTVKLDLDGQVQKAILKDVQFHPVSEIILHADFFSVDESQPITIAIPVRVSGNSPGVREGGKLVKKITKMKVKGLLKDIPDFIDVNIDALELGKSIKVGEINVPGITLLEAPNNAIVSVDVTRATQQAAAAATPGKK